MKPAIKILIVVIIALFGSVLLQFAYNMLFIKEYVP